MNYKQMILLLVFFAAAISSTKAQDFVTRVKITFEKKVKFNRGFEGNDIPDELREQQPKYDISHYNFVYAGGQSLYQFEPENSNSKNETFKMVHDENSLFIDYNTKQTIAKKSFFQEDYIVKDSIKPIKWKVMQETRNIAGYECRKAIGRIYDTVYIVAFYCEQFVMKAGPEGLQGLPGMILGLAIPRWNTTWFATKVELANINEAAIVPPNKGKKLSDKELVDLFMKNYKEYGIKDITPEKVQGYVKGYTL